MMLTSASSGWSKKQLGWRQSDADERLYLPMFQLARDMDMNMIPHGDKIKKWEEFTERLFQLEAFQGKEKTTVQSIRSVVGC